MKRILTLLVGLLMIANVTFAMAGFVEIQNINGVYPGMGADEVVAKWGKPIDFKSNYYYFNPGGLAGYFYTSSVFTGKLNDPYLNEIKAINNPQIVLKPSGVAIGSTAEELIRRLGEPDKKKYIGYEFENDVGHIYMYKYVTPEYTNYSGRVGREEIYIYVAEKINQVNKIELEGTFVHRK